MIVFAALALGVFAVLAFVTGQPGVALVPLAAAAILTLAALRRPHH